MHNQAKNVSYKLIASRTKAMWAQTVSRPKTAVVDQDARQAVGGGLVEASVLGQLTQSRAATRLPGDDRQQAEPARQRP